MGFLLKLELENFKSYSGKQVIGPFDRFTAVIGPNGSGKSNLMDAISFVLGVNSGALRSANLGELVYRPMMPEGDENARPGMNSNVREYGTGGEDGVASAYGAGITASAKKRRGAPQRAIVSMHYGIDSDRTVVLSRSVTLNGVSEYRIDGRLASFAEFVKFLDAQNILVKARNFLVFQGDVEAVASKSGRELTRLFEQICGSEELKGECERLGVEAEQAAEASALAFQQRRTLTAEMRAIQNQREDVGRMEELVHKKDQLVLEQVLWRLFHSETQARDIESELGDKQKQATESMKRVKELESTMQESKRIQAKAQKDLLLHERKVKKAQQDFDRQAPEALELHEKKRLLSQRQRNLGDALEQQSEEYSKQGKDIEISNTELSELERAQARFEDHAQTQMSVAQLSPELINEYTGLKEHLNAQMAKEQLKLDNLERKRAPDVATKKHHEDKCHELGIRKKQLSIEHETLSTKHSQLQSKLHSTENEINAIHSSESESQMHKLKLQKEHAELTERLRAVADKLLLVKADQQESERELKHRTMIETLRRIFPGVHGRLMDLCQPVGRKYDLALGIVLGRNIDAVVVESERTAIECIKYMREQRCGQATFLPLDTLQTKSHNEHAFGEGARLAVEMFRYEKIYEKAIRYACGGAIVCDNLGVAKRICYDQNQRVKAVTMDGTVIHKSGLLTGGTSSAEATHKKWEDREVNALKRERDQLQGGLVEAIKALKKLNESVDRSKLSELNHARMTLLEEMRVVEGKVRVVEEDLGRIEARLVEEWQELERASRNVSKYDKEMNALDEAIKSAENEIFASFCHRIGVRSIREYETDRMRIARELDERRLEFVGAISKLSNKLSFMEQAQQDYQGRVDALHGQINENRSNLSGIERALDSLEGGRTAARKVLDKVMQEQGELQDVVNKEVVAVTQGKLVLQQAQGEHDRVVGEVSALECGLEKLVELKTGLIRRCKLEELELPLLKGSLDSVPLANDTPRMTKIVLDFGSLSREAKGRSDDAFEREHYVHALTELQSEIDRLTPNLRSLDKLDAAEARLRATLDAFEETRQRAKTLKDNYNALRNKRLQLFNNAFKHISTQIDHIYKQLTGDSNLGEAYLTLENTEEPYADGIRFHAKPPGKRFLDMDQLSGGERTIAALSLLFAIHSYRPSPFFILDEVDAALDHGNVQRVTRFLQAQRNLQIIVISLKATLYEKADALVGVYRDNAALVAEMPRDVEGMIAQAGSRVLSLRLTDYPDQE